MLYETKCCAVKDQQENKIGVTKIRKEKVMMDEWLHKTKLD